MSWIDEKVLGSKKSSDEACSEADKAYFKIIYYANRMSMIALLR